MLSQLLQLVMLAISGSKFAVSLVEHLALVGHSKVRNAVSSLLCVSLSPLVITFVVIVVDVRSKEFKISRFIFLMLILSMIMSWDPLSFSPSPFGLYSLA